MAFQKSGLQGINELVSGSLALPVSGWGGLKVAGGAVRSALQISDASLAKLLVHPEANWLLANIAGKSTSNPAVFGLIQKFAKLAGTYGIPVTSRMPDGSTLSTMGN